MGRQSSSSHRPTKVRSGYCVPYVLLSLVVILAMAGVPRMLHQSLVRHRWCPLHHQIEHVADNGLDLSCAEHTRSCWRPTSVSSDVDEHHEAAPDVCKFSLVSAPAIHAKGIAGVSTTSTCEALTSPVPTIISFSRDALRAAPKRSPPDSLRV